ncbi:hypothetical protein [Kineosporia sp. R_H_3]|uniref:hypothetical protein n=1 Tax=Kineosporia sp. R_H_3 TaxID=1961848 RepID=UPI000B4ACB6F|nr:hypothetical protein [Kineosporia sp. R_H_3]
MSGLSWREADGVRYLHVAWAALPEADMLTTLEDLAARIAEEPAGLATVTDARGMAVSTRFLTRAKTLNRDVFGPRRGTFLVYGLSGIVQVMARGFSNVGGGSRVVPCRDEDHAVALLHALRR